MVRASARRLAVLGRALLPPAPLPAAEAEAGAEAALDGGVLTAQQCEHFRTFGFLVLRQAIRPDELEAVSDEFAAGLARKDPTDLIAGVRQQLNWTNLDEHSPKIQALLEDRRFYGAAQQLLGDDVIGFDRCACILAPHRSPPLLSRLLVVTATSTPATGARGTRTSARSSSASRSSPPSPPPPLSST